MTESAIFYEFVPSANIRQNTIPGGLNSKSNKSSHTSGSDKDVAEATEKWQVVSLSDRKTRRKPMRKRQNPISFFVPPTGHPATSVRNCISGAESSEKLAGR